MAVSVCVKGIFFIYITQNTNYPTNLRVEKENVPIVKTFGGAFGMHVSFLLSGRAK